MLLSVSQCTERYPCLPVLAARDPPASIASGSTRCGCGADAYGFLPAIIYYRLVASTVRDEPR